MSAIFTALDALVAACKAAPNLATVFVQDGPPVGETGLENPKRLFIGDAGADDSAVADGTTQRLYPGKMAEAFTLSCIADYLEGANNKDMSAARAGCKAIYDEVAAIVTADPTIGGSVFDAVVAGSEAYEQRQTTDGAVATFRFTISCQADI